MGPQEKLEEYVTQRIIGDARLDYLFSQRLDVWPHLIKLLEPATAFAIPAANPPQPNEFEDWEMQKKAATTAEPSAN